MAVVTRYFSTASAGAGDGTSWANRAALFSGGIWSSIITGFAFNGSDSLEARIGPGTYNSGQTLTAGLFANAPTSLNPLILRACNSSGINWIPPNPGWVSAQPTWDTTDMPIIICGATTTFQSINLTNAVIYGLSFRPGPSGQFAVCTSAGQYWWCYYLINTGGNSGAASFGVFFNCSILITGNIGSGGSGGLECAGAFNTRCETTNAGNSGPGMVVQSGSLTNCTSIGWLNPFRQANSFNNQSIGLTNSTGIARAAAGTEGLRHATTSATVKSRIAKSLISEAVTGVNSSGSANVEIFGVAFNNVTTPIGYATNMLTDYITLNESLTDLFVNPAGGDYRVKATSTLWGKGYGAGDQPTLASIRLPNVRGGADQ